MPPLYQLHVTLTGSRPAIWRRIVVPADLTLDALHDVLQVAMGWEDAHLHQFIQGEAYYGPPMLAEDGDVADERAVRLDALLQAPKDRITYEYDLGDGWEHTITLEKRLPPDDAPAGPRCTGGALACPPEDCGGLWGYYDLLDILADPAHPEHEERLEWLGGPFDPDAFDRDAVNAALRAR